MYRHKLDALSLLFGLLFASIGSLLMASSFNLGRISLAVVWPVIFVLIGLAMLFSARRQKDAARGVEAGKDQMGSAAED